MILARANANPENIVQAPLDRTPSRAVSPAPASPATPDAQGACPACGGALMEIKQKLVCSRCHMICETCCEGGRG